MISFVSASMAVHVHTSPASSGAALAVGTFLALACTKDQISSHWTRRALTPRTLSQWKAAQASPASSSSLATVLMDTSHTRLIERIEDPLQSSERIWTRLARCSLFMPFLSELFA